MASEGHREISRWAPFKLVRKTQDKQATMKVMHGISTGPPRGGQSGANCPRASSSRGPLKARNSNLRNEF